MFLISTLRHQFSAERTVVNSGLPSNFFLQHQKVYSFCQKYVRGKNILEVGSGSGYGTYRLSSCCKSIIGIDKDKISIDYSMKKYRAKNLCYECTTIENFQPKRKFNGIISLQVIEHVTNPDTFLAKIRQMLSDEGWFIVSTPNAKTQLFTENPYHIKEFTHQGLLALLSPYFDNITIYGLHGDKVVAQLENTRKQQVLSLYKIDFFNLRRLLPRFLRQLLFDIGAYIRINRPDKKKLNHAVSENNYLINQKNIDQAIDLIAVCQK